MSAARLPPKVSGLVGRRPDARPFSPINADHLKKLNDTGFNNVSEEFRAGPVDEKDAGDLIDIDISMLVDSPYQYRLVYPEKELLALGDSLKAVGQTSPIRVRQLEGGKFELIAGHRRKRAAALSGISHLKANVVIVEDAAAALELIADNEGSEEVGDYERARAYKVLKDNLKITQAKIALAQGIDQALVSKRLSFFKLPRSVIEQLDKYPRAYSYKIVEKILPALAENPEQEEFVAKATASVGSGGWTADVLVAQLFQMIKKKKEGRATKTNSLFSITDPMSRPILTIQIKPKGFVQIHLSPGVDPLQFATRLNEMLREEAVNPGTKICIGEEPS